MIGWWIVGSWLVRTSARASCVFIRRCVLRCVRQHVATTETAIIIYELKCERVWWFCVSWVANSRYHTLGWRSVVVRLTKTNRVHTQNDGTGVLLVIKTSEHYMVRVAFAGYGMAAFTIIKVEHFLRKTKCSEHILNIKYNQYVGKNYRELCASLYANIF